MGHSGRISKNNKIVFHTILILILYNNDVINVITSREICFNCDDDLNVGVDNISHEI